MYLSKNIQLLRRQRRVTQEQLAERMNVSRQTISKWEGGHSVPDLEKLQAMAAVFGVTLDELTGTEVPAPRQQAPISDKTGLVLCITGAIGLAVLALLSTAAPQTVNNLNESSVVTLNGSGLLMCLAAAVMALGGWLLLKRK